MRVLAAIAALALSACCAKPKPQAPVVVTARNCFGDLQPPPVIPIASVECTQGDATLCLPYRGAVDLDRAFTALRDYVAKAEARCRPKKDQSK